MHPQPNGRKVAQTSMAPPRNSSGAPLNLKYHKPRLYSPDEFSQVPSGTDPEQTAEAANQLAHALLNNGQSEQRDSASVKKLVDLVDEIGMDTIAELWSDAPAVSLGGALWRLYALRTATINDGERWAGWYRAGYQAQVARAIAGAVEPPDAYELQRLTGQILSGAYAGDFAVALDRAAAYCRIVSLGQSHHAEQLESGHPVQARSLLKRSQRLLKTAEDLDACAGTYRAGALG